MIKVTILLATYNGARFIGEQIDSIIKQTHTNWHLLIRDDQSSDATRQILVNYQAKYPQQITLVASSQSTLGSALNFNALLQSAKHENYIMFCDQDDYWVPDKIECTIKEMLRLERIHGLHFPLLVHTGFRYVDINLKPISSKKNFQALRLTNLNLSHMLAQNPVYGCTAMINGSLAALVDTVPAVAESHDYWIAMVASAFGKVSYLSKRTVLYRQHENNISGNYNDDAFTNRVRRIFIEKRMVNELAKKVSMVSEFKKLYNIILSKQQENLINDFINLSKDKSLSLFYRNVRNGVRKQTLGQTSLLYVSLFLFKGKTSM